jgi:DNA-binding transcriptional ArsR family regulator
MAGRRETKPVHDPRVLRAIAHPLRNRILGEMSASGSLRAADIARELGIPANQASFHLRQLAKYGLVEEAPEEARDRRDRVWRLTAGGGFRLSLKDMEAEPGGKAAISVWRRSASAWAHHVVDLAYDPPADESVYRAITDQPLKLTKAEAEELAGELDDVLVRWSERTRDRVEDRRTYVVFQLVQPYPDDVEAQGEDAEA